MGSTIVLAADVAADASSVYDALSTTEGQRAFWTEDCEVGADKARFGFPGVPVDLQADVTTEAGKLVRMTVTSGFPGWEGSTWEWELGPATRAESGTSVLFRHGGFGAGYGEADLGHTAQTWAMIMDRLSTYVASGKPQPFFPAAG
jgi:hypothetical protein